MRVFVILLLFLLCGACQSGKIPCPKAKAVKIKKTNPFATTAAFSAKAETDEEQHRYARSVKSTTKTISNVTLEEWDCPKPGSKKYLPKEVKDNIRKNMRKISRDDKEQHAADSVHTNR